MSAAKLDTQSRQAWNSNPVSGVVRHITRPQPELRCPECQSILYTRRHPLCGICGHELPAEILFSAVEAARVSRLLEMERQKHRAWMRRARDEGR